MDAERPTFILSDTSEPEHRPIPSSLGKRKKKYHGSVTLPDYYPKYETEFYDVVSSCAEYIDKIKCAETRLKFHKRLSKIFVIRHKGSAMALFRDLVNNAIKEGDNRGQKSS